MGEHVTAKQGQQGNVQQAGTPAGSSLNTLPSHTGFGSEQQQDV